MNSNAQDPNEEIIEEFKHASHVTAHSRSGNEFFDGLNTDG